jgi:hypothetical protein
MPVNALWKFRKLYSTGYIPNAAIAVELTKYAQTDYFDTILVQVSGSLTTGTGGAGTATGRSNPEDLLINATLQTSPTVAACLPFNQVSGRSLMVDAALNKKCFRRYAPIIDNVGGAQTVDVFYELNFKRKGIRKAIEYGFDISRYTSALLTLTFGDQTRLYSGSSNSWPLTNLTVTVLANSSFNVNPDQIHAVEMFEQNFPVLATQPDFLINQLPAGFIYTDLCFLTETNNALVNNVLSNIDIEGGGRVWMQLGDNNSDAFQRILSDNAFDGTVVHSDDPRTSVYTGTVSGNVFVAAASAGSPTLALPPPLTYDTGIYAQTFRSGMFTRNIDALTAQIIIKLGVTYPGSPTNIRLFGRRMVPGAVYHSTKAKSA